MRRNVRKIRCFFFFSGGGGFSLEGIVKLLLPSIVWPLVDLEETGDWCLAIQTGIMDS